jgi:hypothetical protein
MSGFLPTLDDNLAVICTTHIKLSLTRVNNGSFVTVLFHFFGKNYFCTVFSYYQELFMQ